MKELKCKNCGAPLTRAADIYKCEYCGALYQIEVKNNIIQMTTIQSPPAVTLGCELRLDKWATETYSVEDVSKYTLKELSAQLAGSLAGYLKLTTTQDYQHNAVIVRGTVRVLPPDYRF